MKRYNCAVLLAGALTILGISVFGYRHLPSPALDAPAPANPTHIEDRIRELPLAFEAETSGSYIARGDGYSLRLTETDAALTLHRRSGGNTALHIALGNANTASKPYPYNPLSTKANYFLGSDPAKWRTNVPIYANIRYDAVYPGIDVEYYGNGRNIESDFVVAPHADPRNIRLQVKGASRSALDRRRGDLVLSVDDAEVRLLKPVAYQIVSGNRQEVSASYVSLADGSIGFHLGRYDTTKPLVIDPVLDYSGYLQSTRPSAMAVDSGGNVYIVYNSSAYSTDFTTDILVKKFDPTVTNVVYFVRVGGARDDSGNGIAVDGSGNVYVTGDTSSLDFPHSTGAYQTTLQDQPYAPGDVPHEYDAIVFKLGPAGTTLLYSTYLGGGNDDSGKAIAIDSSGNAYVTGTTWSDNFPPDINASTNPNHSRNTLSDIFVTKVNSTGSGLAYSKTFGAGNYDHVYSLAVDSAGSAIVAGSEEFAALSIITQGAAQGTRGGGDYEGFVVKVKPDGSGYVYATYVGGSDDDQAQAVAVDSLGNAYVAGYTDSTNFPTIAGAVQTTFKGTREAFVTKYSPNGLLLFSTLLGGTNSDSATTIGLDSARNVYVAGTTTSTDFPTVGAIQGTNAGSTDAFITKLDSAATTILYSTYLGGNGLDFPDEFAVDSAGNVYVAGSTSSTNFPRVNLTAGPSGAFFDGFIARISDGTPIVTSITPASGEQDKVILGATIGGFHLDGATAVTFSGTGVTGSIVGTGSTATSLNLSINVAKEASRGLRTVRVTTPKGTSNAFSGFTVKALPTITGITPASGSPGDQVPVVITGTNLSDATGVSFSGTGITAAITGNTSATSLSATFTTAGGAPLGVQTFTVTTPDGTSQPFNGFNVAVPEFALKLQILPQPPQVLDGKPFITPSVQDYGNHGGGFPGGVAKLRVTATRNGSPASDVHLSFEILAAAQSNSHQHINTDSNLTDLISQHTVSPGKGDYAYSGGTRPWAPSIAMPDNHDPKTGPEGIFETTITAGDMAFDLKFLAKALPSANAGLGLGTEVDSNQEDLRIGIKGFVEAATPDNFNINIQGHSGTWGTPTVKRFLDNLAQRFVEMKAQDPSCTLDKLKINGISLPYGGLFDYQNFFSTPHKAHRTGEDIDIGILDTQLHLLSPACQHDMLHAIFASVPTVIRKDRLNYNRLFPAPNERPWHADNHWHLRFDLTTEELAGFPLSSPLSLAAKTSSGVTALNDAPLVTAATSVTHVGSAFEYQYSLRNVATNKSVNTFKVASSGAITSGSAPSGWVSTRLGSSDGWFWGAPATSPVSPGTQVSGLTLKSSLPPTIQGSLAEFDRALPVVLEDESNLDDSQQAPDDSVADLVLGPHDAFTFQAQPFLRDLIQMKAQAVQLGWIDNSGMGTVDANLTAADTALTNNSISNARRILTELLLEIEGKRSYLHDEGYALLSLNVQYLLDHLPAAATAPTLNAINPNIAVTGAAPVTITLSGTHFVSSSVARIGSAALSTTFNSSTQLTAVLPSSYFNTAGSFLIHVLNAGTDGDVSGSLPFTVVSSASLPSISGISPALALPGTSVSATISGNNLSAATAVSFSGTGVTAVINNGGTATSLPVTITVASDAAPTTRTVTVTTPFGSSAPFAGFEVVTSSFVSINDFNTNPPGLNQSIAPHFGGPFTLTVNGQNFVDGSVVSVGSSTAATTFVTSRQLTAGITSSILATTGAFAVQVKNPDGSASNSVNLLVTDRGDLNSSGSVNVGDALVTALTVGGVRKPPLPVSVGDFNLSGAVNIGDALALALFSGRITPNLLTPAITSPSPQPATRTAPLTINGSGFSTTASNNQVMFSAENTSFVRVVADSVSGSGANMTLTVTVPANAVSGMIAVNRIDAAIAGATHPIEIAGTPTPLVLTGIAPYFQVAVGSTITLSGLGFDLTPANNTVTFRASSGTVAGTVTAATANSLSVAVPFGALCGPVTVSVADKTSNSRTAVIAGSSCPVQISGIWGGGDPGDILVVEGSGFDVATPSNNAVRFAAAGSTTVRAPVLMAGATQLHIRIPEAAVGGDITVSSGTQTSNAFVFRPATPPTLTSITPNRAPAGTTLTYTLAGSGFVSGATTVTVAGTGVTVGTVTVASSTSITVPLTIDGAAALGTRVLRVQTPGGSADLNLNVVAQPVISSLNPATAVQATNIATFTVSGSNFDLFTSPAVAFIAAGQSSPESKFAVTNVSVVNASTIRFAVQVGSSSSVIAAGDYRVEIRDNLNSPQIRTQAADLAGVNTFTVTVPLQSLSVSTSILRVNFLTGASPTATYAAQSDVLRVMNFVSGDGTTSTAAASPMLRVNSAGLVSGEQTIAASGLLAACYPAVALNTNLIVNADAETERAAADTDSTIKPACWATTAGFTSVQYGVAGVQQPSAAAGANFFAGGAESAESTATQTIDVSALSSSIDPGSLKATLSALLGGSGSQSDNTTVTITFKSAASTTLGSASIGPVSAVDRANSTGFVSRSTIASVPPQTRFIEITIKATRSFGTYNDGYADNVSLSLNF